MSKKEAVLLVSRAIAALQAIAAAENIIYLVKYFLSYSYSRDPIYSGAPWFATSGQLATLVLQLVTSLMFWNCSPWLAGFLLPVSNTAQNSEGYAPPT